MNPYPTDCGRKCVIRRERPPLEGNREIAHSDAIDQYAIASPSGDHVGPPIELSVAIRCTFLAERRNSRRRDRRRK